MTVNSTKNVISDVMVTVLLHNVVRSCSNIAQILTHPRFITAYVLLHTLSHWTAGVQVHLKN